MNNRNYDHLQPNAFRFRKINLSRLVWGVATGT